MPYSVPEGHGLPVKASTFASDVNLLLRFGNEARRVVPSRRSSCSVLADYVTHSHLLSHLLDGNPPRSLLAISVDDRRAS